MTRKRWLFSLFLFSLLALLLLIPSVRVVHFNPGKPLGGGGSSYAAMPGALSHAVKQVAEIPLWKQLLLLAALLASVILFLFMIPAEMRGRLIMQALRFALVIAAVLFLLKNRLIQLPGLNLNLASANGAASPDSSQAFDPSRFTPPLVAPWIIYLIGVGVSLALLALIWAAFRFWTRFHVPHMDRPLEGLAAVARSSLTDLAYGNKLEDVIIQAYARMSEVVDTQRGLRRAESMTPREFADRLERAGLPANAVARLTRLFESVRYGAGKSNQKDVDEAVSCLNSIVEYCGAA